MLEAADALIVNQRASVTDMALPSKLTAYFAAGRPVIGAVAPDSETAAELRRAQAGWWWRPRSRRRWPPPCSSCAPTRTAAPCSATTVAATPSSIWDAPPSWTVGPPSSTKPCMLGEVTLIGTSSPNERAWRGTAVLVTGGDGFVGRALVKQLRELGADVRSVRRSEHDLRAPEAARAALAGAEVVFHLAARVGGIGFNLRHPAELIHDNLLLAANVFEQSRRAGVERLVAVSSVCAYPESPALPFSEDALWDGHPEPSNAPYGVAKRVLVTLSEAYFNQHGVRSCVPVLTNLYGPGDHDDLEDSHVIPALIRKFAEAEARP